MTPKHSGRGVVAGWFPRPEDGSHTIAIDRKDENHVEESSENRR